MDRAASQEFTDIGRGAIAPPIPPLNAPVSAVENFASMQLEGSRLPNILNRIAVLPLATMVHPTVPASILVFGLSVVPRELIWNPVEQPPLK